MRGKAGMVAALKIQRRDRIARLFAHRLRHQLGRRRVAEEVLAVVAVAEEAVGLVQQVHAQLVVRQMVLPAQQVAEGGRQPAERTEQRVHLRHGAVDVGGSSTFTRSIERVDLLLQGKESGEAAPGQAQPAHLRQVVGPIRWRAGA